MRAWSLAKLSAVRSSLLPRSSLAVGFLSDPASVAGGAARTCGSNAARQNVAPREEVNSFLNMTAPLRRNRENNNTQRPAIKIALLHIVRKSGRGCRSSDVLIPGGP